MVHEIENFFGCYLLYCTNPKYKGRTYIGFTVNPKRRIAQHNAGKHKGGAWKTSGRGPWDMTLIVHGFPSDIAALRFEWAWQNPLSSRRLKHVCGKTRKETAYQYRIRVLSFMLHERPWSILPLTVRWLKQEYYTELNPSPPTHIPLAYGPVDVKQTSTSKKANKDGYISLLDNMEKKMTDLTNNERQIKENYKNCDICLNLVINELPLHCVMDCGATYHIKCLADDFLKDNKIQELIPIEGCCPICHKLVLWGDLIRKSKGFHQYLGNNADNH